MFQNKLQGHLEEIKICITQQSKQKMTSIQSKITTDKPRNRRWNSGKKEKSVQRTGWTHASSKY